MLSMIIHADVAVQSCCACRCLSDIYFPFIMRARTGCRLQWLCCAAGVLALLGRAFGNDFIQTPVHQFWVLDGLPYVSAGLGQIAALNYSQIETPTALVNLVPSFCDDKLQRFRHQPGLLAPQTVYLHHTASSGALWADAVSATVQDVLPGENVLTACSKLNWDTVRPAATSRELFDENGLYRNTLLVGKMGYSRRAADAQHHRVNRPKSATAQVQLIRTRPNTSPASSVRQTGTQVSIAHSGSSCVLNNGAASPAAVVGDIAVTVCLSSFYGDCTPWAGVLAVNLTDGSLPWANRAVAPQFAPGVVPVDNATNCWSSVSFGGAHPVPLWGSLVVFSLVQMQAPVHVFDVSSGHSVFKLQMNVTALPTSSVAPGAGTQPAWSQLVQPVLHSSLVPLPRPGSTSDTERRVYSYSAEGSFVAMDFGLGPSGEPTATKAWSLNILRAPQGGIPRWAWGMAEHSTPNGQVPAWPTPDATDVQVRREAPGVTLLAVGYTWDLMQKQMNWGTSRAHPGRTGNADGRFIRNGTAVIAAECCSVGGQCHVQELLRKPCNLGSCVVQLLTSGEGPLSAASANMPHVMLQTPSGGSALFPLPGVCSSGVQDAAKQAPGAAASEVQSLLYPGTSAGLVGPPLVFPREQGSSAAYRIASVALLDGAVHAADKQSASTGSSWTPAWRAQADSGCAYVSSTPALVDRGFVQEFVPQVGFCQSHSLLVAVQLCQSAYASSGNRVYRPGVNRRVQVHFMCTGDGSRVWASTEAFQANDGALNPFQKAPGRRLPGWMDLANATVQWHPMQAIVTSGYRTRVNSTENSVPLTLVLSSSNGTILALNALAGMSTPPPGSFPPNELYMWSTRSALGLVNVRDVSAPRVVQWGVNSPPLGSEAQTGSNGPVLLRGGLTSNGPAIIGQEIVTGLFVSFAGSPPYSGNAGGRGTLFFSADFADFFNGAQGTEETQNTIAESVLGGESYGPNVYSSSSALSTVASSTTGSPTQAHSYFATSSEQGDDLYSASQSRHSPPLKKNCGHFESIKMDFAAHRNVQYRAALVHNCSAVSLHVAASLMFVDEHHRNYPSDVKYTDQMTTGSAGFRRLAQPLESGTTPDVHNAAPAKRRLLHMLPFVQGLSDCIPRSSPGGVLLRPDLDRIFLSCVFYQGGKVGLRVTALRMFSGRHAWTVRTAINIPPPASQDETQRRELAQMRPCLASNASLCVGVQYLPAVSKPMLSQRGSQIGQSSFSRVASKQDLLFASPRQRESFITGLAGSAVSAVASDGTAVQIDAVTGAVLWQTASIPQLQVFSTGQSADFTEHVSYAPSIKAVPEPGSPAILVASVRAGLLAVVNASTSGRALPSHGRGKTDEQKVLQSASTFVIVACSALAAVLTLIFVYAVCQIRARRHSPLHLEHGALRRAKVPSAQANLQQTDQQGSDSSRSVTYDEVKGRLQGWADTQQMLSAVVHPAFNIYGAANLIFGASPESVLSGIDESAWGSSTSSAFIDLEGFESTSSGDVAVRTHGSAPQKQFDLILALTFAQLALAVLHFVVHLYFFYIALSASIRHDRRVCTTRLGSRYQALSLANGNFSLGMWPLGIFNTIVLLIAFDRSTGAFVALLGSILSWAGSLVVPAAVDPRQPTVSASTPPTPVPAHAASATAGGINGTSTAIAPLETEAAVITTAERSSSVVDEAGTPTRQTLGTAREDHRMAENCIPRLCNWSEDTHWFVTAAVRGWLGLWFVSLWLLVLPLLGLLLQVTTGFNGNKFTYKLLQFGVEMPYWLQAAGDSQSLQNIPQRTALHAASSTLQGLSSAAFALHCIVLLLSLWPITQFAWTFYVPVCPACLCSPQCLQGTKVGLLKAADTATTATQRRLTQQMRQPLLGQVVATTNSGQAMPAEQRVSSTQGMCIPGSDPLSPCCGCLGAPPALAWWLLISCLHILPVTLATVVLALPLPADGPTDDGGDFGVDLAITPSNKMTLTWLVGSSFGPLKPDSVEIDFYWEHMTPLWPAADSAWMITLAVQFTVLAPTLLLIALLAAHVAVHAICLVYSTVAALCILVLLVPLRAFWVYILEPIVDPPENHEVMSPQRHDNAWCGSVRAAKFVPDPYDWWHGAPIPFIWLPFMPQTVYLLTCGRRDELKLADRVRRQASSHRTSESSGLAVNGAAKAPAASGAGGESETQHSKPQAAVALQLGAPTSEGRQQQYAQVALGVGARPRAVILTAQQVESLRAAGIVVAQQRSLSSGDLI